MKQKFKIVLSVVVLIAIVVLIVISLPEAEDHFERKLLYEINYFDEKNPGSKYNISIYNDNIEILEYKLCDSCENDEPVKYSLKYSNNHLEQVEKFVKEELEMSEQEVKTIYKRNLNDYQNAVLLSLVQGEEYFDISVQKYDYKIVYTADDDLEYFIFVNDNQIMVKKVNYNTDFEIIKNSSYEVDFKDDNIKMIMDYVIQESKIQDKKEIYKTASLYKNEKNIILSLINNDESYLEEKPVNLLYQISFSGVNCLTPILRLYDDNTYEYYYTYSTVAKEIEPKVGIYDYSLENIIDNLNKYETEDIGPMYIITDYNNKEYTTPASNKELNKLLTELNIDLTTCLIVQA